MPTMMLPPTTAELKKLNKTRAFRDGLCSQRGLILGSEGCWEMGGHRRGGWGEKDYLCLVPSAKLHLPIYHGLLFKKYYNLNDSTFIKFVFEFVIKPSFSIIQHSINKKE